MSRGITIAELVQQVLYAIYKVRLNVGESDDDEGIVFHSKSDKFKEVVMEANFVLQEFQKEQDWNFLRERWDIGPAWNGPYAPMEINIPDDVYKLCTGYGDAIRLHRTNGIMQIPIEEARTGNRRHVEMFNEWGEMNIDRGDQRAFVVGDTLTFNRPWHFGELGKYLETDVIRYIEPLHICDSSCEDHCPKAYEEKQLTWLPDPYYIVVRTAAKRAEGDPSVVERVQSLTDEGSKLLSAMRENDSAHTIPDTYDTCSLGYVSVL